MRLVERRREEKRTASTLCALDPESSAHDEGGSDRGLFQAVDLRDVRVIQRGERLRFAFESRQSIRIVGERVGKNLQRDVTIEFRVPRAIDLAHPTRAERGDDLVGSEARAWRKPHRLVFSWGPRMLARMTAWVVLFLVQVTLISTRRVRVHQRLGYAGIGLALLIIVLGIWTALRAAKHGSISTPVGFSQPTFLIVPLGDIVLFTLFFGMSVVAAGT